MLSRHDLELLITKYPVVALRIMETLARNLEETRTKLQSLVFRDVLGRVAGLLLEMADDEKSLIEGYSHEELASRVGCLWGTFTEALNRLKNTGDVAVSRKRIRIMDWKKLQ